MKEVLIALIAVVLGVYITSKRFQHRFNWRGSRSHK